MFNVNQRLSIFAYYSCKSLLTSNYVKSFSRLSAALPSAAQPQKEQVAKTKVQELPPKEQELSTKKYKVIYTSGDIVLANVLSKSKLYAFAFTAAGVSSFFLDYLGVISNQNWLTMTYFGATSVGAFCGVGVLIKNMVGRIELSEDKTLLRFFFIDYWGKMIILEVPPDKVKILEHRLILEKKIYVQLKLEDHQVTLKLMKGKANVNQLLFSEIFGNILV